MSNTIQVKRGANASLPTLNAGEFGFSTDTKQIYIGDGAANHELAKKADILSQDPISYRVATGEALTIADYEQLLIYSRYLIEGTGKLTIDGAGEIVVIGGHVDEVNTTIYSGSGVFNSTTGVVISIGADMGGTGYSVIITITAANPVNVGEISVESKSATQFTVKNTGSDASSTFDWILVNRN